MNKSVAIIAGENGTEIAGLVIPVMEAVGNFDYQTAFGSVGTREDFPGLPPGAIELARNPDAVDAILVGRLDGPEKNPEVPQPYSPIGELQEALGAYTVVWAEETTTDLTRIPSGLLNQRGQGIYRPACLQDANSAPAVILSVAMALRHSLDMPEAAADVEAVVAQALEVGAITLASGDRIPDRKFVADVVKALNAKRSGSET